MTEPLWVATITQIGTLVAAIVAARQATRATHALSERDLSVSERLARLETTVGHLVRAITLFRSGGKPK